MRKRQQQILRLTTPTLHPKEQRPFFGDPGLKTARGPRSLRMTPVIAILAVLPANRKLEILRLGDSKKGNCRSLDCARDDNRFRGCW